MEIISPRSILDIGCGAGAWLKVFAEHGIVNYYGVDGDYVDRSMLLIEHSRFHPYDLRKLENLPYKADLAVCLEVGEHIPEAKSAKLVEVLVKSAPVVLFSAALPGQGGTNHINEKYPGFWQRLFDKHNYVHIDAIRPRILRNENIEIWYHQNIIIYASRDSLKESSRLSKEYGISEHNQFEIVHKHVVDQWESYSTVRGHLSKLPQAVVNAMKRRLNNS